MKHYILGTDEAGYGPNLGPLVVSCVVWEMTDDQNADCRKNHDFLEEFEQRLAPLVAETPAKLGKNGKIMLVGDSKKLYTTGKLQILCDAVLAATCLLEQKPAHWPDVFAQLLPEDAEEFVAQNACLFEALNDELNFLPENYHAAANRIAEVLTQIGVTLYDIKAKMISPRNFNQILDRLGNKSTLLTETTLGLVKNAIDRLTDGNITVLCDKHGGRNRYTDAIYQFFPDDGWIQVITEGTPLSVYRFNSQGRDIEFRFQSKADRHIPAALASMTAKLLRELAMLAFNRFWQQRVDNLQPTAGYPVDALRFFGQIEEVCKNAGIPKSDVWREK